MFTPRAFALQGVGFSALALALQGLLYGTTATPPTTGGGVSGWAFRPSIPFWTGDPLEEEEALLMAGAI